MRINILTQPLFCNYGGLLQNYALQEVLRQMGHEPLTVNIPPGKPGKRIWWKDDIKTGINLIRRIHGSFRAPFLSPHKFAVKEHELSFPQREFIEKYIDKVNEPGPFSEKVGEKYPAEGWIVGSDQVWRPWCSPYIENCFFDFVDNSTIKIAYAASFGTDQWEINTEKTEKIKELAKRFKAISVREESGVGLCRDYLGIESEHVLDPTLLLSSEDYLKLIDSEPKREGKYIAVYVLDLDRQKERKIKKIAKDKGFKIVRIGQMHKDRFDSVESWISGIANAECVITDSFHGTVFSLIFNKPVNVLENGLRGNSRIQSLERQLHITKDISGFYLFDNDVKNILTTLRDKSKDFLRNNLR